MPTSRWRKQVLPRQIHVFSKKMLWRRYERKSLSDLPVGNLLKNITPKTKAIMTADATEIVNPKPPRKTPNWKLWKNRATCSISDATALSLNIPPPALASLKAKGSVRYKNYLVRLKTANLATYEGGPIKEIPDHKLSSDDPGSRIIFLASFVEFARNNKTWRERLSSEFLSLDIAEQEISPPSPSEEDRQDTETPPSSTGPITITLPYTTAMLECLFQVMRDQDSSYHSDRPPKQSSVAASIDDALGNKPKKGIATRMASALAAAIRPDELKELDQRTKKH